MGFEGFGCARWWVGWGVVWIRDDAGERRGLVSVRALSRDGRMGDTRFAAAVERAQRSAEPKAIVMLLSAALGLFVGTYTRSWLLGAVGGEWVGIVSIVLTYAGFCYIAWSAATSIAAPRIARLLLSDGICPSCGYSLHGVHGNADAITLCPECEARWHTSRIIRAVPFTESAEQAAKATSWTRRLLRTGLDVGPRKMRDARGRTVPVVNARLRKQLASARGERAEQLKGARDAMARHGMVVRILLASMFLYFVVFRVASLPAATKWWHFVVLVFSACMFLSISVGVLWSGAGVRRKVIRDVLLRHGLCPSCAAAIGVAQGDEDGELACGECGAAWTRSSSQRTRKRREDVCPECRYSFDGLERDAEGGVVCPECGRAWRWDGFDWREVFEKGRVTASG